MKTIILSIIFLGGLGLIFGLILAYFSRKFAVKMDKRVEEVLKVLPGSNCGACGQAGCSAFAEAVVKGDIPPDGCVAGGSSVELKIDGILGLKAGVRQKEEIKAVLLCNGGSKVRDRFTYSGINDCKAANLILGGQKECIYGCLGIGSCVEVCPFGAIRMGEEGLPIIDARICTGCGKCVDACPKGLIILIPRCKDTIVRCKSEDKGAVTARICRNGCIACRKCETVCKAGAITVVNGLARIDYAKCTNCGECAKVCPKGVIEYGH